MRLYPTRPRSNLLSVFCEVRQSERLWSRPSSQTARPCRCDAQELLEQGPDLDLPRISLLASPFDGCPTTSSSTHLISWDGTLPALYVNSSLPIASASRRSVPEKFSHTPSIFSSITCRSISHQPLGTYLCVLSSFLFSHGRNGCLTTRSHVAASVQSGYADVSNGSSHHGAFHRHANHQTVPAAEPH